MNRLMILSLLALAAPAGAEPPAPRTAATLLGAIDVPLTPEAMARAGVTEAFATETLGRATARRYLRQRAVSALGLLGTDTARRIVERTARKDADVQVRVQAVISLARAFGPTDRAAVATTLRELSGDAPAPVVKAARAELERLLAPKPE